jgi:hypothetical protein
MITWASGITTICCNGKEQDATSPTEKFRGFPQYLWANTRMLQQHRPRSLPTRYSPNHHSRLLSHLNRLSPINISTMKQSTLAFFPSSNNEKAKFNAAFARIRVSCNISFIIANIFTNLHILLLQIKIRYFQDNHIIDTRQSPKTAF